ncbi:MAG TPA: flagellar motor switch protein FliM, partial [Desulfobacteraceae bacterium]|nr:flagellar motor switch protein FliM [Desulfobacteraceae bacterium]
MPDQILSQEEIDALLGAMAEGEVDVEAEKADVAEAKPYDLTSQSIMLREQFFALEEVNDKLAGSLHNSLSSSLQAPIDVNFVSMEMIKFSDFLRAFASPTSYNIFAMEPLIGSSLLVIEAD